MFLLMYIDSDNNPATGNQQAYGADYVIILAPGEIDLQQWNGSAYVNAPSATSLSYAYSNGATIRINTADLGNTRAFNFGVIANSGVVIDAAGHLDFSNVKRDAAPDFGHGLFAYSL